MFKRNCILIVAILVISDAYASDSPVLDLNEQRELVYSIAKNTIYVPESTAAQTVSDTTGIIDELKQKSLKQIFSSVLEIKEGEIGTFTCLQISVFTAVFLLFTSSSPSVFPFNIGS